MKNMKMALFAMVLLIVAAGGNSFSQVSFGTDIYSRYVWRGMDFGNSPSFQPAIIVSASGFSIGTWGAYSFAGIKDVYSEHDLLASYAIESESGTFGIIYTDYYFPSAGLKFFNYKGEGNGAHTLEIGLNYGGPEAFPISIAGYYNFHNDVDKSTYFELGYPFTVKDVSVNLFVGASGGKSAAYGTDEFNVINAGLTFSKEIPITDKFSLPIHASYIINPNIEQSYLIVGISL